MTAAPPELLVPPRFRVVGAPFAGPRDTRTIVLHPSAAFGDGTHESTRMCLQALAAFAPRGGFTLLDVGSGTGILSIGAAKLGGTAAGVDVDPEANRVAGENAAASGVAEAVSFSTAWPEGAFEVVVANILREVLVDLAAPITARLAEGGLLVLAGLVSTDVPAITARYAALLAAERPEVFERDPWRCLVWRRARKTR